MKGWLRTACCALAALGVQVAAAQAEPRDGMLCHAIDVKTALRATADIDAQTLGVDEGCELGRPELYCVSASHSVEALREGKHELTPRPVSGPTPWIRTCYRLRCERRDVGGRAVQSPLGGHVLDQPKSSLLCLPTAFDSCGVPLSACTFPSNLGFSTAGKNLDDTFAPACGGLEVTSPGLWLEMVGNGERLSVLAFSQDFQTQLSVYSGGCDALTCVAAGAPAPELSEGTSEVAWDSVAGEHYLILVHGEAGGQGNVSFFYEDPGFCEE